MEPDSGIAQEGILERMKVKERVNIYADVKNIHKVDGLTAMRFFMSLEWNSVYINKKIIEHKEK